MYHPVRRKSFGHILIVISIAVYVKQSLSAKINDENDQNTDNDLNFDNNISDFDSNFNDKLYKNDWNGKNLFSKDFHRHTIANKVDDSGIKATDIDTIKDKLKATSNQNKGDHDDKTVNKSKIEDESHILHVLPLKVKTDVTKSIKIEVETTTEFDLTVIPLTTSEKNLKNDKLVITTESVHITTPKDKRELNITTTQTVVTTKAVLEETTLRNIVNVTINENNITNSYKSIIQSKENIIINETSIIKDKEETSNKTIDKTPSREPKTLSINDSFNFTTKIDESSQNATEIDKKDLTTPNSTNIETTTQIIEKNISVSYKTGESIDFPTAKDESSQKATEINKKDLTTPNSTNIETTTQITEKNITVNSKTENATKKYPAEEVMFNSTTDTSKELEDVALFSELDLDDLKDVPEDYYDAKDVIPTKPPSTDALSVIFGLAGSVVESVAERVVPKGLMDLFKRMQKQSEALEVERLRSREENGGLGQFTRGILKTISSGITKPLNQLMAGARDIGALDTDRGFVSSVASGVSSVANVANSLSDAFKNRVQAIYPGTIWCGDGHSAQARSSELGLFFFTDTCCRQHDACKIFIKAGETKYGLTNTGLFTRSHCGCDQQFRECLRKTNSLVSSQIGLTYFNVLGPQCFRKTHPIVRCTRKTRLTGQKCEEYELDYTKEKMWQWFDNETF